MFISPRIPFNSFEEVVGESIDLQLLKEDAWLSKTEVRYFIQKRNSLWHLTMIYISVDNPMRFICRKIDSYSSEKKALTYAKIFKRGIQKDARGTLKTNEDAFYICNN